MMHRQDNNAIFDTSSHTEDVRIKARAIEQRWKLGAERRQEIIEELDSVFKSREASPRAKTIIAKCFLEMEKQNQSDEHHQEGDTLKVEHNVDVNAIAEQITGEEGFVEYLRARACEGDTDAGAVRQVGLIRDAGTVGNGKPHGGSGSGADGDRNGDE